MVSYNEMKRRTMPKNLDTTIVDRESQIEKTPNVIAEEHVLDSIVDHKKKGENWKYLIRWYGRDYSDNSSEALSRLP